MAKNLTKEEVLDAIENSQGLISKIQKKLQAARGENFCWETVNNYVHKWPETEEALKAEKEAILDLAENNIFKELVSGDAATSKWYLKMKGKDRGYIETQEILNKNPDPLNINLSGDTASAEDLASSPMVEVGNAEEGPED